MWYALVCGMIVTLGTNTLVDSVCCSNVLDVEGEVDSTDMMHANCVCVLEIGV
jgi:hypothetical protein